ncbi:MAG TPA: hypothetical protein VF727_06480 [Allosphingosinicella sp.]
MFNRFLVAIATLILTGSSASAANLRPLAQYQKISEAAGGWTWYLNKSSVRPAGPGMYTFWLTGDNGGSGKVRHTMMQVKVTCSKVLHIPLHTTHYGAGAIILSDTLIGDHLSNRTKTRPGTPVDAAKPWVCR